MNVKRGSTDLSLLRRTLLGGTEENGGSLDAVIRPASAASWARNFVGRSKGDTLTRSIVREHGRLQITELTRISIIADRCASGDERQCTTRSGTGVIDERGEGERTTVDERSRGASVPSSEAVKSTTATTDGRGGSSSNPGAILSTLRVLLPFSLRDLGTIFIRNVRVFSPLARSRRLPLSTLPEIGAIEDAKYARDSTRIS